MQISYLLISLHPHDKNSTFSKCVIPWDNLNLSHHSKYVIFFLFFNLNYFEAMGIVMMETVFLEFFFGLFGEVTFQQGTINFHLLASIHKTVNL